MRKIWPINHANATELQRTPSLAAMNLALVFRCLLGPPYSQVNLGHMGGKPSARFGGFSRMSFSSPTAGLLWSLTASLCSLWTTWDCNATTTWIVIICCYHHKYFYIKGGKALLIGWKIPQQKNNMTMRCAPLINLQWTVGFKCFKMFQSSPISTWSLEDAFISGVARRETMAMPAMPPNSGLPSPMWWFLSWDAHQQSGAVHF